MTGSFPYDAEKGPDEPESPPASDGCWTLVVLVMLLLVLGSCCFSCRSELVDQEERLNGLEQRVEALER